MTAFDGVNDGVPTTINVIVVAQQQPAISGHYTHLSLDMTGNLKLISDSAQEVAFTATINAGASGEPTEAITFRPVIGDGLATTVKLVSAAVQRTYRAIATS